MFKFGVATEAEDLNEKQEEKVFCFTYKLGSITTSWKCLPQKRRNFNRFLQPYGCGLNGYSRRSLHSYTR